MSDDLAFLPHVRDALREVPWRIVGDFRNKLIHNYFGLDLDVIWKTVTGDVPFLLDQIEGLVDDFKER